MKEKLKLFEMFAGYGGASFALKKAGIPFECVGYSEIDKFAIRCYEQNHDKIKNYGDATKINPEDIPDFDLLTGGFPCQSFSVAGKGLGELDIRGTLFNEIIRIAEVKRPKYMLLENVKGLTTKKHKSTFEKILSELDRIGYTVDWKVLNSKEYGIPQNRERVFFVCFRDTKDWEKFSGMPEKEELKLFLKYLLEEEVDEKYYLKEETVKKLSQKMTLPTGGKSIYRHTMPGFNGYENISPSIKSSEGSGNQIIIQVNKPNHSNDRVYSVEGISPTLNTMQGGNRQPFIKVNEVKKMIDNGGKDTRRDDGCSFALTGSGRNCGNNQITNDFLGIRKLTPKECFRLMGFLNDEINIDGLSDTQKYKLAGNGWDINLVSKIFKNMFEVK